MGKFDGFLICSDIDGTLIDDNFKIPKANIDAINYFKSEGGLFTLATGRTPQGANLYIDLVKPNAPVVCQNGAGVFDYKVMKYLYANCVGHESKEVIEYVKNKFPGCGIEVVCENAIYFIKENAFTTKHMTDEKFEVVRKDYKEIKENWIKLLIAEEKEGADDIQKDLENTSFNEKYKLVRSYPTYYEILQKTANKGTGMTKLVEILNADKTKTMVIGDNDNDAEMLLSMPNSFAVKNASPYAKQCAAYTIQSTNNEGVIAELVDIIEKKFI